METSTGSSKKLTVEAKAIASIGKLKYVLEKYSIDMKELFNRYDKNQSDAIFLEDFTRMIKKIDDKL